MYETYSYPHTINADSNAKRSLSFYIYNNDGLIKSVANSMIDATDKKLSLLEKTAASASIAVDMLSNLNANDATQTGNDNVCIITLPLPNTFNDTQVHGWNQQKSVVGDVLGNIMEMNIADTSITEGVAMVAGAYYGSKYGESQYGAKGMVAGAVGGAMAGLITGAAIRKTNISGDSLIANVANSTGQRKPIVDPSYFQNYTGSTPRNFSMKYDLVPNNTEEAYDILMIIAKFKQYSSPSQISSSPLVNAPYHFKIRNDNTFLTLLTAMDSVVLTSMSVDYGADGNMEMFGDGMPKYIGLTLTFAETRVRTAEDYSTKPDKTTLG